MQTLLWFPLIPFAMLPDDLHRGGHTVYSPEGEAVATLAFEPDDALLVIRWHGYITPDKVYLGAREVLAAAQQVPARVALSDGSQVMGDWLDLLPWVRYDFLPAFIAAGIRALAFVPSDDPDTRYGMKAFIEAAATVFPAQVHELETDARAWLRRFAAAEPVSPQ